MEPMTTPSATLATSSQPACLRITGDWTLAHYASLKRESERLRAQYAADTVADLSQLGRLDTAGASLLAELLGSERLSRCTHGLPEASRALLKNVYCSVQDYCIPVKEPERNVLLLLLERIGCAVGNLWQDTLQVLGFVGLILETLLRRALQPHRWRFTPVVAHIEQTGLDAAPIVALLTFLVGAVVAFLGATVLADFGATIFTVDLVAFSFLREFAVLLTAILMAGRTASAFTAQIGSMKANEEIDAIRTLGLNPIELLVVPRVLALLIALPLLTFLAMLCGLVGGAVVCALTLDISPAMFLSLLQSDIGVQHFLVSLAKAPFFAFLIGLIGCYEGLRVSGSAESLGRRVTQSVVEGIFVVIIADAVFSILFVNLGI